MKKLKRTWWIAAFLSSCVVPKLSLENDERAASGGSGGDITGSEKPKSSDGDGDDDDDGAGLGGSKSGGAQGTGGDCSDDGSCETGGAESGGRGIGGAPSGGGGTEGTGANAGTGGGSDPTECEGPEVRCDDHGIPQMCSTQGQWVNQALCTGERPVCENGECVACRPREKTCRNNAPATCADDGSEWELQPACQGNTPSCIEETATCGRCVEDQVQCNSDGTGLLICNPSGQWDDAEECPLDQPVCLNGKCQQCDPGAGVPRKCEGSTPYLCVEGTWQAQPACQGDDSLCDPSSGLCVCNSGGRCLDSNTPQLCSSGQWVNQPDCSGDLPVCLEASGACGCVEDQTRCKGSAGREQCQSGVWSTLANCAGSTPVCTGEGTCSPCKTGAADRCSPDRKVLQQCTNDRWATKQRCDDVTGGVCDDGACTTTFEQPGLVLCGDGYCAEGQTCCANSPDEPFCSSSGCSEVEPVCGQTTAFTRMECDGPSDCPADQECCYFFYPEYCLYPDGSDGVINGDYFEESTRCSTSCSNGSYGYYYLCEDDNSCPDPYYGTSCSSTIYGDMEFYVCLGGWGL